MAHKMMRFLKRVEKTEALNADLQALEKKVDSFGKVFDRTGKKLQACLQSQPAHDMEKRQKRLPEYALAQSLTESSALLGLDSLLGQIFQICGDAQQWIAYDMLKHELSVENDILAPIHTLLETDIPAIVKHKRSLQKMVLDMDSAKTRYTAALKSQQAGETKAGRVDNLRDEYEEACYKVDQLRDQLATGMFKLASKESELSRILLQLIKCQADFHRTALENLEKRMPQMEEQIEFWNHMPVYGKSLEDHLRRTDRTIALVIEESIKSICILGGLEEEGLFRIAGAANKVKKLKAAFDLEQVDDITEEYDVHCIAGCLKQYLRELPDPLMTCALYPDWMQAAHLPADQRLSALNEVLQKLPKVNYDNLRYLIKFLAKLTEFQEINKMSPSNIAIVIGPNLIWPEVDGGPCVLATTTLSAIVEALISHCDSYFFPGDEDIFEQIVAPNNHQEFTAPPDLLNSTPALATAPFQSYNAGLQTQHPQSNHSNQSHRVSTPDLAQHGHPAQNLIGAIHWTATSPPPSDPMTASTGSLTFNEGSMKQSVPSPKPPRRVYKKPAPLPPGERPVGPAPPPPVPSPSNVTSPPSSASTGPGVHGEKPALPYPVKPPPPERISSAVSEQALKVADKPDRPPSPTRARPNIPPPERPTQPDKPSQADRSPQSVPEKPDKPEKPSKPNINPSDKLYPSLPPVSPSRTSSGDNSPPQTIKQGHVTEVGEKPPLPPPPAKPETGAGQVPGDSPQPGHKRQGSSGARPPRPQPPPPPPPVVKPIVITEDKTNDANPEPSDNTEQRTPHSPKEQTYL